MKKFLQLLILFCFFLQTINCQSFYDNMAGKYDVIVAADGSGDYATVMEAILASSGNEVIFIRNGIYTEKVEILSNKNNLTIVGENIDSTIIQYGDYSGSGVIYSGILSSEQGNEIGTSNSHTFYNQSIGLTLVNLTIRNTAGRVGQAVALHLNEDRTKLIHCRIMGFQDTFLTNKAARHYIKDCFIEGDVDFIFGGSTVVFDSCVINSNRSGSHITAPATDETWNFGYVFQNCIITADHGVTGVFFARPWHNYPKVTFMNCYLGAQIAPAGWDNPWGLEQTHCQFYEYNNYGPGSNTSQRVNWSAQLSDGLAAIFTENNIFGSFANESISEVWHPDIYNDSIYKILRSNTELLYTENYNSAYLDSILYDTNTISGISKSKTTYSVTLPAGTTKVPIVSAVPNSRAATIDTIIQPLTVDGSAIIKVTSGNGVKLNYTINFNVEPTSQIIMRQDDKIRLLTNPITNSIEFEIHNINSEIQLLLFDMTGKKVMDEVINGNASSQKVSFKTNQLSKGTYLYIARFNRNTISGKLIKQ